LTVLEFKRYPHHQSAVWRVSSLHTAARLYKRCRLHIEHQSGRTEKSYRQLYIFEI